MDKRDLISILDLSPGKLAELLSLAADLKGGRCSKSLPGKTLGMIFQKPSHRTRVSFDVAMYQLGGHAIYLSQGEIGLGTRESVAATAQVLGRYVDGIVARTNSHNDVKELARYARVPVINGLSDKEHPCQALADLLTIWEKKGDLRGAKVAYLGDGNNVAASLALACAMAGVHFSIASPPDYRLDRVVIGHAGKLASANGSRIQECEGPREAVQGADVVYTDVWVSMGQEGDAGRRRGAFAGYRVDEALLSAAGNGALFMHPLPAHEGEEIAPGLLEHQQSVVYDQAENRLHMQKAVLLDLLG